MPAIKDPASRPPCQHMEAHLNELASGKAGPVRQFFIKLHLLHCAPCRRFLLSLTQIVERLKSSKLQSEDEKALARLSDKVRSSDSQNFRN